MSSFYKQFSVKKWLLVVLDRWLSYTVTIVWALAWADVLKNKSEGNIQKYLGVAHMLNLPTV